MHVLGSDDVHLVPTMAEEERNRLIKLSDGHIKVDDAGCVQRNCPHQSRSFVH